MKHQHSKSASATIYPTYIISDLGQLAIPQCIVGQVGRGGERRRWRFVVSPPAQGRRRHEGVTGLGSCGLA